MAFLQGLDHQPEPEEPKGSRLHLPSVADIFGIKTDSRLLNWQGILGGKPRHKVDSDPEVLKSLRRHHDFMSSMTEMGLRAMPFLGGMGVIKGVSRSRGRTIRQQMASENIARGKPLKSIAPSKVGDLIESPIGKVRYDGEWQASGTFPKLFQYTPTEGPAKGMTFTTKTQNLDDIAKGALKIAGKEESIPEQGLKGLVDETTRGLWLHGRGTYPKTGETFADSRVRVGNLGEPYGMSLTADKELLSRSFAEHQIPNISDYTSKYAIFNMVKKSKQGMKNPQALELKNELLDIAKTVGKFDDIPTPQELYEKVNKSDFQAWKEDPDSESMFADYEMLHDEWSDFKNMQNDFEYMKEMDFTTKEVNDNLFSLNQEMIELLDENNIDFTDMKYPSGDMFDVETLEKAVSKLGFEPPPFARVFPKFGGKPGEKVLPAWVAPETEWAQEIIGDTYIESLPEELKEYLVEKSDIRNKLDKLQNRQDEKLHKVRTFMWDMQEKYGTDTPKNHWTVDDELKYEKLSESYEAAKSTYRNNIHLKQKPISEHIKEYFATGEDRDLVKEEFNKRISENLLKKGYKALLYSPERYNEYEMRMLDPNDVMMLDMRKQKDPALKRMYESITTGHSITGFRGAIRKKGSQAEKMDKWKEQAADREGASLRNIYEKITWEDIDRILNKPSNPTEDLDALIKEADELEKGFELSKVAKKAGITKEMVKEYPWLKNF